MSIEYNAFFLGPGESVFANLCQYHLESCYVDMLVSDSAHTVWREGELFDAIITDRKIYNWTVIGRYIFIIQISYRRVGVLSTCAYRNISKDLCA